MSPKKAMKAMLHCARAQRPFFLWGSPGIGKSSMVYQMAAVLGRKVTEIRAVLLDPVDLRGIPSIVDGRTVWCPPVFLPTGSGWILFIDELNSAPLLVQAALYQLILDRKLGEYELPPDCIIVAAGNRETDRAVTTRMPSALANRFVHIDVQVHMGDWTDWALPKGIRLEVIAFLRMRPQLLFDFDPKRNDKAFATPRSWEFVGDLLEVFDGNPNEMDVLHGLIAGTVGDAVATEFMGFLEVWRKLPNPDRVIDDPDKFDVPKEPAVLFALCGALARKANDQNMANIIKFAERMRVEFMMALVLDAVKRNQKVAETRAYITWAAKNNVTLV